MTATAILDRLGRVAERGTGKWIACCPAHDDHNPSLSVAETSDGAILIHCWAGCDAIDIVSAIGLTLADLFPDREQQHQHHTGGHRPRISASDALRLLSREAAVLCLAAADLARGISLSPDDLARLMAACTRIYELRRYTS